MKASDFRRSVQNPQHDRAPGDAPSLGRVARMPGTGLPTPSRGKRRSSELGRRNKLSEHHRKLLKIRVLLVCVFPLILLGLGILFWIREDPSTDNDANGLTQAEIDNQVRVVSKFPSPSKDAALELVKKGLAVRKPEQVGQFFRTMENRDQEVVDFLSGMAAGDGMITDYQWLSSIDANRLSLDGINVIFKGKDRIGNRLAILTPDQSGNWKIDFDAFARTVKPSWKEILDPATQVAVVRVFIAKDSYFNGPFRDEKQWSCFGMASADTEGVILGYSKVDSPQEAALQAIMARGEKLKRVTIEIRRVASGDARQFEISQVIAEDWVVSASIFQANFADAQLRLPDPMR